MSFQGRVLVSLGSLGCEWTRLNFVLESGCKGDIAKAVCVRVVELGAKTLGSFPYGVGLCSQPTLISVGGAFCAADFTF